MTFVINYTFWKKVFTTVHVVIHRPQNGKAACIRVTPLPPPQPITIFKLTAYLPVFKFISQNPHPEDDPIYNGEIKRAVKEGETARSTVGGIGIARSIHSNDIPVDWLRFCAG